jgi:hypothetical protein
MHSWLKEIDRARTEAEVVATTRDYLALWSPGEFPEECRQIRIDTQADIARWRDQLAESYLRARATEVSARLQDLVTLVARADERLGEIRTSR